MRRLIMLLMLALPLTAGAHTVVYEYGKFLRLLRPEQTLREYVVLRYAAEFFDPAPGMVLIEREDSAAVWGDIQADSVIVYDWRELAVYLDTVTVQSDSVAREVSRSLKPGDLYINRDSVVTPKGKVIRLRGEGSAENVR